MRQAGNQGKAKGEGGSTGRELTSRCCVRCFTLCGWTSTMIRMPPPTTCCTCSCDGRRAAPIRSQSLLQPRTGGVQVDVDHGRRVDRVGHLVGQDGVEQLLEHVRVHHADGQVAHCAEEKGRRGSAKGSCAGVKCRAAKRREGVAVRTDQGGWAWQV